jgi:hypothetical protein
MLMADLRYQCISLAVRMSERYEGDMLEEILAHFWHDELWLS